MIEPSAESSKLYIEEKPKACAVILNHDKKEEKKKKLIIKKIFTIIYATSKNAN